ncbi:tyrosine-type recombinase/integrase [Streptomyces nigrescens]|uniref:Site-specific integrase n=1 Tax=Streptomyces nigrescens TaxID=1920 RepID=A0ABY7IYQ6_STRNI|nr:site-specific integrase [Streptomyces nigrescens]WAU03019.1 site-specific integrase [Streptomyces nigrescens]
MGGDTLVPGSARLHLVDCLPLLRPEEQVFEAMLAGWRNQQLTRNLSFGYVSDQERTVRAFARHADGLPWKWAPQHVEEWSVDLRSVRGCARSTVRNYQGAVRQFCDFVTNPAYGWAEECLLRFGAHPVQVVHDWNAAVHADEGEGEPERRAFTRPELEAFFDYADEQVVRVRGKGRKGWLPTFGDARLFKTAYGYGLRRNETRMLNEVDFGPNPHGREFGDYGTLMVRHGKAKKGSPPKRRRLTVWQWTPVVIEEWVTEVRPGMRHAHGPALWPSERGLRVGLQRLDSRFAAYRDALGLDPALEFHSLRQVVHHPPDRRRLRSAVRPAAGRPRVRIHHRDLHVRLLRLPNSHPSPGPGRHR